MSGVPFWPRTEVVGQIKMTFYDRDVAVLQIPLELSHHILDLDLTLDHFRSLIRLNLACIICLSVLGYYT